jgi:hypothetical protein
VFGVCVGVWCVRGVCACDVFDCLWGVCVCVCVACIGCLCGVFLCVCVCRVCMCGVWLYAGHRNVLWLCSLMSALKGNIQRKEAKCDGI